MNSNNRKELSCLQGIGYSYSSLFADIEPVLLPEVLALVGGRHGPNELYRMLTATAPDLVSIVNREAIVKQRISVLTAELHDLNKELVSIELVKRNHRMIDDGNELGSRKRRRSASF